MITIRDPNRKRTVFDTYTAAWGASIAPCTPGQWRNATRLGEHRPTFTNDDDTLRVEISVGDGCTARAGWAWVSTLQRDDGLYEHVFRRDDGK